MTQKNWNLVYIFYALIILYNAVKIKKYMRINKEKNIKLSINKLDYYRDIPREGDSTPSEAGYLYNFNKDKLNDKSEQSSIVAATILSLAHKKTIKLNVVGNDVEISFLNKKADISDTEKPVFDLLLKASKKRETFKISELQDYAENSYYKYSKLIQKLYTSTELKLYKLKFIDKGEKKEYYKSKDAESYYQMLKFFTELFVIIFLIGLLPFYNVQYALAFGIGSQSAMARTLIFILPLITIVLIKLHVQSKTQRKIAVITLDGANEKEQWTGLKKFLEEFSLLNEKKVPDLVLWEKYLIYATVFGVAEKVIEQMKASYPEVFVKEYFDDEEDNMFENYPVFYCATRNISYIGTLNNIASSAYQISKTQISKYFSSGSGRRRWILFWRWRRRWPVAGMGGR